MIKQIRKENFRVEIGFYLLRLNVTSAKFCESKVSVYKSYKEETVL